MSASASDKMVQLESQVERIMPTGESDKMVQLESQTICYTVRHDQLDADVRDFEVGGWSASNAIGQDGNLLNPGDLDGILSKHHTELAQLVVDGSEFDVSQEELEEFIGRFGEVGEFAEEAINQSGDDARCSLEMVRHFDNSEVRLDRIAEAGRRSFLIRRHMIQAKIEDGKRRKWYLHWCYLPRNH